LETNFNIASFSVATRSGWTLDPEFLGRVKALITECDIDLEEIEAVLLAYNQQITRENLAAATAERTLKSWRDKSQSERDWEAVLVQESLLADYEELAIDKPADPLLVSRFYGRIKELKKTLGILKQRSPQPPTAVKLDASEKLFQAANTASMNLSTAMKLSEHPESCLCYGCALRQAVVDFAMSRAWENTREIREREAKAERWPGMEPKLDAAPGEKES
jgi:hypothetical protein